MSVSFWKYRAKFYFIIFLIFIFFFFFFKKSSFQVLTTSRGGGGFLQNECCPKIPCQNYHYIFLQRHSKISFFTRVPLRWRFLKLFQNFPDNFRSGIQKYSICFQRTFKNLASFYILRYIAFIGRYIHFRLVEDGIEIMKKIIGCSYNLKGRVTADFHLRCQHFFSHSWIQRMSTNS